MEAADGDGEPLRVPPWLPGSGPGGDGPVPDPLADDPFDPQAVAPESAPPAVAEPVLPAADYVGRRELAEPWRRRIVLAGMAGAVLLVTSLAVASLGGDDRAERTGGSGVTQTGLAGPDAQASDQSPSATPSASASDDLGRSSSATSETVTELPQPSTFGPVTFEAEAPGNTLSGSASVTKYLGASGGSIVRNIGDWGSQEGDGVLRFEDITVPLSGTYTLKLLHVHLDNERTRTAIVTVSGSAPQPVTVPGNSTCCTLSSVRVELRKGRNTITFSNDIGHAPSIDLIVLSLP
jgi:hypothetical protein